MPDTVHNPDENLSNTPHNDATDPNESLTPQSHQPSASSGGTAPSDSSSEVSWDEVEAVFAESPSSSSELSDRSRSDALPSGRGSDEALSDKLSDKLDHKSERPGFTTPTYIANPPLALVETAFLASTASLLWLISYYLSIGPWMRILFPIPIALVHLRWGSRSAWMAAIVSGLLLSVLMGPYLSLLFLVPYGILGVQLGFLWQRRIPWGPSIFTGTIVATLSLFFRLWLLSTFIGEDLWIYLTGRITDLLEWVAGILVNWGILGVGMLGQPDIHLVQLATIGMVIFSDLVYMFTVHLAAWLLLERLGSPISTPPQWVQVILDEA
ncbi:MAG: DUF2232 domain-containing protein [Merismopedia sp. SIO2A8]|nr:DUF2232 domain-containing protein [Merismopedia sp. SIO2A8]